ncbi:MAG: Nramp family divalent metal transporter [Saprospiraceae bacterium]|nr:Nramp family divalent metal transporter [Saprospiraceae bacterium]
MRLNKYFGPSTLVTAAFIGPGTIMTCSMAGIETGYSLIWALIFSIFATIILQEMAARLGFITQSGLGEALNKSLIKPVSRIIAFMIVIGAILIGNAAYEAGNIAGSVLGAELIFGASNWHPWIIGGLAFVLLLYGKYKWVERTLIALVLFMSLCFLITCIIVKPDLAAIIEGFIPSLSDGNILLVMALIGTTVVPYNLFLHASAISKKYKTGASLTDIRIENFVSILLGGLISICIVIVAASAQSGIGSIESGKDLAMQLEPLAGKTASYLMGLGLWSAGLSSALTAPLAAAYAAKGIFDFEKGDGSIYFKLTWLVVLLSGLIVISQGYQPTLVIKFAQIMNAVLLPFISFFLIYACNQPSIMRKEVNSLRQNILSGLVIIITLLISIKSLWLLF